jgi:hypothetical protein
MQQMFGIRYRDLDTPEILMKEPMALIPFTPVGQWLTQLAELSQDPCYSYTNQYKDMIAQREFSGPEARSFIAPRL